MRRVTTCLPKVAAVVALAVLVALVTAGCGSSSHSGSNTTGGSTTSSGGGGTGSATISQLNAQLTQMEKRPTTLPIDVEIKKKIPRGLVVDWLPCGSPTCYEGTPQLAQAAHALGWKLQTINEGITPESVQAAWEQVVRNKPDAIIISGGFPPSIFKSELATELKRKVPVVAYGDPYVTPHYGYTGIVDGGLRMRGFMGPTEAKWVTAKSGGHANVLYVYSSGYPVIVQELDGYKSEIAKICPKCHTTYYNLPLSDVDTNAAGDIADQVEAHPNIDYVVAGWSDLAAGLNAALLGAGVDASKVHVITQANTVQTLQAVKSGQIQMDIPGEVGIQMWQMMDVVVRAKLHLPVTPATDASSFNRWIITKQNIPPSSEWSDLNSDSNYQAQYKKLWGVG